MIGHNEPGAVIDSPESGLYTLDFSRVVSPSPGEIHYHWELRILSPTQAEGLLTIEVLDCVATSTFTLTAQPSTPQEGSTSAPAQEESESPASLVPVAGDWLFVVAESPTYPADCPSHTLSFPGILWPKSEVYSLTADQVITYSNWGLAIEDFENPAPGLYIGDLIVEAGTQDVHIHSEVQLLSATEAEGTRVIDYYGCIVTSFFTMTAQ